MTSNKSLHLLIFTSILFLVSNLTVLGQGKEAWHWYFGLGMGLDFSSGTAVVDTSSAVLAYEGCVSYSDENGNLLFYSNGGNQGIVSSDGYVWDRQHNVMDNGDINNIAGCGSAVQSSLVTPVPNDPNRYYLFTVDCIENINYQLGLRYTIIDMNQNGGDGAIAQLEKGVEVYSDTTLIVGECLAGTRHANGEDYWVVTNGYWSPVQNQEERFFVFHVTQGGVAPPLIYSFPNTNTQSSTGQMKISADGTRMAYRGYVYDFNPATGLITNPFDYGDASYGMAFSKSGRFIYSSASSGGLYQYDLNSPTPDQSKILLDGNLTARSMQLGPDGKLYIARDNQTSFLSVINRPDSLGVACNYVPFQIDFGTGFTYAGLPNYIDYDPELVSVSENHLQTINVYPNPSTGDIQVTFDAIKQGVKLVVITTDGRVVEERNLEHMSNQIKLKLSSGVYFLELQNDNGIVLALERVVVN